MSTLGKTRHATILYISESSKEILPNGCWYTRIGERAKRRRWRAKCQNATPRSVASDTTTLDLGSPSPRGAIIRSSLIKLREMSKDSAMLARRTMRTQIITSLVAMSSYPSLCVCVCMYMCSFSIYILLYSMCVYACICRF